MSLKFCATFKKLKLKIIDNELIKMKAKIKQLRTLSGFTFKK